MSFLVNFVFGFAFGIGLVLCFARFERTRSKQRNDLAAIIAAFERITVDDTRKLLPADYYPSWVVFSNRQKLNWLNQMLDKIWPYVDQAASELIKSSVEPMLEEYRPVVLAALKFSKLTLGTVAPQFTGVTILEGDAKSITMELDLQWDGNPNIILDIKTHLGVGLPIQVKNIGFTGVLRFLFKPLVDEIPCFGAISFSLRENTNLDFKLKVIGGDISSIPGISDAIEETIRDAIEDSITWPVRQVIPIIPGDYSYLELKPVGTLEVKLVQAKELTNKDIIGKSDPFAVLFIRPVRSRMKSSKIINNNLNPIWNENFEFIVEDESTQHLTVRVFDDEGVQAAEIIGCAQFPIKELEPGKIKDVWLKLVKDIQVQKDNKNRGQVQLELLYCPHGTENTLTNAFSRDFRLTKLEKALKTEPDEKEATDIDPTKLSAKRKDVILRGVLSVTVISAEDLPAVDLNGKSDPFVILIMRKIEQKQKTRVVHNSLDPVWNQTFDFVVEDALHDLLLVEVYDHDTFGKDKMGRVVMTLTRVILEGEFTESFPIDGTKSGKISLHLKWTSQPIFRD
ncbi:synaptotagmin-4-like [Apium graveolens]|uniref:synaptotagmin-4-like n=1 Tax=Apium graveolens TaxID=4045 RepID=UPI003D7BCADF